VRLVCLTTQRALRIHHPTPQENDDLAQEIARNGQAFIRERLQMEDVSFYWQRLLQQYAELQQWDTVLDEGLRAVKG
jgi:hypothetical protein